ncbi:transmembrane protein 45B-like isoform X1 [Ciona intestinalis]
MGTWEGHISPGLAFYSFGIVFCFQYSKQHLMKGRIGRKTTNKMATTWLGKGWQRLRLVPLDAFMKILYGFGAAMAELFYPPGTNKLYMVYPDGTWAHLNEWQHFTMYMSFAASGIVDMLSIRCAKKRLVSLEKAAVAAAFYITALLLFFHRHGKHELEMDAHTLLLYANLSMCVVLTAEIWWPFDQRLMWAHTVLVMQMGSWLFNLAFILFPLNGKHWDPDDGNNQMVLPIFFCWHIFFNCFILGLIFTMQYLWVKVRHKKTYQNIDETELNCCVFEGSNENLLPTTSSGDEKNDSSDNSETILFLDTCA